MVTVAETNALFTTQHLRIALPYPANWLVKEISIVEKRRTLNGVKLLLFVAVIDDEGREISDLLYQESEIAQQKNVSPQKAQVVIDGHLPRRIQADFTSKGEALDYLKLAVKGYFQMYGFTGKDKEDIDLFFQKDGNGIFVKFATCLDPEAMSGVKTLVSLRKQYGAINDYWLVIPAFQDSLGVSMIEQETWLSENEEYLAIHRIGVFAADNLDPNCIYAFTVYPQNREFMKYFIASSKRWPMVRQRYLELLPRQNKS